MRLVGKSLLLMACLLLSCQQTAPLAPRDSSSALAGGGPAPKPTAEERFRELLAFHLEETGLGSRSIDGTMFLTPPALRRPPEVRGQSAFLRAVDAAYGRASPQDYFDHGRCVATRPSPPKGTRGAVTLIVFPGIFSEFIPADPFEEVLRNQNSLFASAARPKLEALEDQVFRLADQKQHRVKLSEVVRVGSYDRQGRPWVNVIVMTPKLGSLESLGTVNSTVDIYARRLDKVFQAVPQLGEVYLVGYSRGGAVALEFLRAMHGRAKRHPWVNRIRGVVGLGAVFYGSQAADQVFAADGSPISRTAEVLAKLAERLEEEPQGLTGTAYQQEAAARGVRNTKAWADAVWTLGRLGQATNSGAMALLKEEETLARREEAPELPGLLGNFELMRSVMFELINMKCPYSCYFQNIRAFKQLVGAVLAGMRSITTEERLRWWKDAKLPVSYRILSLAAAMPPPVADHRLSPLLKLPYYGTKSPDFNLIQRPSYYTMLDLGAGLMNDSSMALARARYWPQLDPMAGRRHDFLGVLASHHWGIAFPYAVAGSSGTPNPFPRAALVAAIGSYLREMASAPVP